MDQARLLSSVNRIHAAAMAPHEWSLALEEVADLTGGDHAVMVRLPTRTEPGQLMASTRLDIDALARSLSAAAELAARRPRAAHATAVARLADREFVSFAAGAGPASPLPALRGPTMTRAMLVSDREFERSAYYNEVVRPMRGFHAALARLGPHSEYALAICRGPGAGDFDMDEMSGLAALVPHFTTALQVQQRLGQALYNATGLTHLLDRIATALVIVDGDGRACFVNQRAAAILDQSDGLAILQNRLVATDPGDDRGLREALGSIGRLAARDSTVEIRLRLQREHSRVPLLLSVLPAASFEGHGLSHRRAVAAIFITEPDAQVVVDRTALVDVFRLTRREGDVVVLLACGQEVPEIAATLGLGIGAVRNYLKSAYEKTQTHSKAALVALARGFVAPVA